MESLLFGFTVVPQTHRTGCALLLCPLHQVASGGIPFSLLLQMPQLTPTGKHATREKSASPIFCFYCEAWVSAWLSDRFYKIPAVPAGKWIGWTALSRGNSQKRIHFMMIWPPFTASSKQLFTNYSIGSHISGWRNRKKCVNCVFHTEINKGKMLIERLFGSQAMLSFFYCHTRHN